MTVKMPTARRGAGRRMAAVGLIGGLVIGGVALGASAASAAVGDTRTVQSDVDGNTSGFMMAPFRMTDGGWGYCLVHNDGGPETGDRYQETSATVQNRVGWILAHSYPALSKAQWAKLAGDPSIANLSDKDAAGRVQNDIWAVSGGIDGTGVPQTTGDWLVTNSNGGSISDSVSGSVSLAKGAGFVSVQGKLIGPFKVSASNVSIVSLSATGGATVVDAAGGKVANAHNGDQVWISAPDSGSYTLRAYGVNVQQSGHMAEDRTNPNRQTLSVRDQSVQEVNASLDVTVDADAPATIATSAVDKADGDKTLAATGGTVSDKVSYTGLVAGADYAVSGELFDKATGQGTGITAKANVTPSSAAGSVMLDFTVPASAAGKSLVAFETIAKGGSTVVAEMNINNAAQTVTVAAPAGPAKLITNAVDYADGDRMLPSTGGFIVDNVDLRDARLTPGKTYTIKGELFDKATGRSVGITNDPQKFGATANAGVVPVWFDVPASMAGKSLVVYETVTDGDTVVAQEHDLTNSAQTVSVAAALPVPVMNPWVGAATAGVLFLGTGGVLVYRRKKTAVTE